MVGEFYDVPSTVYGMLAVISIAIATTCGPAEYKTGVECCPMCSPGHYVVRHCTEFTSTTCQPCPPSAFTEEPNGLTRCISCSVCDSSSGVRVKRNCSSTSDTLCEPLEGHYCTDPIKDGCQGAVQHTTCLPGQYIKLPGSASSDTVCEDCGNNNTYSDGTFTSCRSHTRCSSLGMSTRMAGTNTADAECEERRHHVVLWVLLTCGCVVVVVLALKKCRHRKCEQCLNAILYDTCMLF